MPTASLARGLPVSAHEQEQGLNSADVGQLPARGLLRWLSVRPFDGSTPEGRASERHRRAALTAAAAALAKMVAVGTALISIPLTLHYLGAERFGMWMTISSLVALLAFADFGIANGVLNVVAEAHGRDDGSAVRRAIASGLALLTAVALLLVAGFAAAYPFVHWPAVFNVREPQAQSEAGPALAAFVACYAATIPLVVIQRAQMGLQQGFLASVWQVVGSLCGLAAVLVAIHMQAGLMWLVLALAGAPLLAALLNALYFFAVARPELRPGTAFISRQDCRAVAGSGALFFVLQLAAAVAYSSDNFIIAQLLGAPAVADYAVPEKLFALLSMAVAIALGPLWPAYGEAIARGDVAWVRATLKRSILLAALITAAGALVLLLFGHMLIQAWVGSAVTVSTGLLAALAVWKTIETAGIALAMYMNATRYLRMQVVIAVSTCVAAIALKLILVPLLGLAGVVWAMALAYVVFAGIPYAFFLHRIRRDGAVKTASR